MQRGRGLRNNLTALAQALMIAMAVLCVSGIGGPARANLVQNGNFLSTDLGSPGGYICQAGSTCVSNVTDWGSTCNVSSCGDGATVASLLFPGTNGAAFNSNVGLWSATDSPDGGNMIAIDGDPEYRAPLFQTISGLTTGGTYQLQFYQAAGQQLGSGGATTEQWQVSLGSQTIFSPVMNNASAGFVPWTQQTLLFTATSASEILSFLSVGTPSGVPPVVLLANVSLDSVPEPATLALFAGGCLALWQARNRNRR